METRTFYSKNSFKAIIFILLAFGVICLVTIKSSIYSIRRDQQVIITQNGIIVGDAVTDPGLHFKIPFFQKVHYLDQHLIYDWNTDQIQVTSLDGISLSVELNLSWKIGAPIKYFQTSEAESNISILFETIFASAAESVVSSKKANEIWVIDNDIHGKHTKLKNDIVDEIKNLTTPLLKKSGVEPINLEIKGKPGKNQGDVVKAPG